MELRLGEEPYQNTVDLAEDLAEAARSVGIECEITAEVSSLSDVVRIKVMGLSFSVYNIRLQTLDGERQLFYRSMPVHHPGMCIGKNALNINSSLRERDFESVIIQICSAIRGEQ